MEIIFYLTNDCNLKCKYCYQGEKNNKVIDFEVIKSTMIKECEQKNKVSKISFFGGEPLLQKDIIYKAVNLGNTLLKKTNHKFMYSLTTNGTLIDDEFIKFCKKNKIAIGISIDGDEVIHNLNRKTQDDEGSFKQVLENSKKCLKANLNVMALPVVCLNNVEHLAKSVDYLVKIGFKSITLNLNYNEPWDDTSIDILRKECRKLVDIYYNDFKNKNYIKIYPLTTKIYFGIHKEEKCTGRCSGERIAINSDGKFYPCIQFVGDERFVIGDYKSGINIEKKNEIIKRRISAKTACEDCALKRRCIHDCGCARISATNDIIEVTPLICETERIFIEEADKLGNKLYQDFKERFLLNFYIN